MFKLVCLSCGNKSIVTIGDKYPLFNGETEFSQKNEKEGVLFTPCGYDGEIRVVCNKCGSEIEG